MEKEIEEIIKKNLPQQMGETLKKVLEKGESDARELENVRSNYKDLESLNQALTAKVSEYKALDDRNAKLEARERDCDKKEKDLKVQELTFQLTSEKEKTEFTKSVALGLVRNIEYRRTLSDNHSNSSGKDQYGNPVYTNSFQNSEERKNAD